MTITLALAVSEKEDLLDGFARTLDRGGTAPESDPLAEAAELAMTPRAEAKEAREDMERRLSASDKDDLGVIPGSGRLGCWKVSWLMAGTRRGVSELSRSSMSTAELWADDRERFACSCVGVGDSGMLSDKEEGRWVSNECATDCEEDQWLWDTWSGWVSPRPACSWIGVTVACMLPDADVGTDWAGDGDKVSAEPGCREASCWGLKELP